MTHAKTQIPNILMVYIFLTLATSAAFWQIDRCDFVNYDDTTYVTENSHIQSGLTMDGILWALTTSYAANWHPLTWISHMLDVQFFGLNPQWHHLVNLLFHTANTLLLFFVFHRVTNAIWQSAFVASLFAIHPLHVESVAWVAERKDVLSTFFWILTMGTYFYYVERPGLRRYLPVLILFALGLMAKPMLVTLPFVLLILDYWPLQRFGPKETNQEVQPTSSKFVSDNRQKGKSRKDTILIKKEVKSVKSEKSKFSWELIRPLLREKIPFFALTALSSVATYIAQKSGGAVQSIEIFPLSSRISNAFVSYVAYIGKMIWPNNLAVFYPYPRQWQFWQVLGAGLILIAVTLTVIRTAERFKYLAVGWLWYMCTLVPVVGLVQVGSQARADRYTYVPLIGLFIMVAWGIPELLGKWRYRGKVLFASSILTLSCFFIVTWIQLGYWKNSLSLFDHASKVTVNNVVAFSNLGNAHAALGSYRQAILDCNRAIEINPKFEKAYYTRGYAYAALGNQKQAIEDYSRAIEINPKVAEAYSNRGNAYATLGNRRQAIEDYNRAIEINPKVAEAYSNRGASYAALGNQKQAIEDYSKAIEINPQYAEAYSNRGASYHSLGNFSQAIEDYGRAVEINPQYALAFHNRAISYARLGNQRQALEDLKKAAILGDKGAQNVLISQGTKW